MPCIRSAHYLCPQITTVRNKYSEPDENEDSKLSSELGAIFISMVMQDVPFLVVRLYTIITYNLITYSLIFFTSKNMLVISLLFYKIAVILQLRYCPQLEGKGKDEDDEKIIGGYGDGVGGKRGGGSAKDGDDESQESSPSKYALSYEYEGVAPHAEKRSQDASPARSRGVGEANHRNRSKTSLDTKSDGSSEKNKANKDGRPNELTVGDGKDTEKMESPGDTRTPTSGGSRANGVSPETSKSSSAPQNSASPTSSGTPKSHDGQAANESGQFPSPHQASQPDSPKDGAEPVIITPTKQSAKPGDPDFKPYTSVVKLP